MNKSTVARCLSIGMMVLFLFNGALPTLIIGIFFGLEASILDAKEEIVAACKRDNE